MRKIDISEREKRLPEKVIGMMLRKAIEDKSIISLGPGEPDFPAPRPIVQFTKKYADQNHYSPVGGRTDLKKAIIKKMWKDNKIRADMDNVIVTTGSTDALLLASACTLDYKEEALLPNPSFLGYEPTFKLLNAKVVDVPLRAKDKFEIDPDEVRKKITKKTKLLMLNTPSNPTGTVVRKKILEELADIAVDKGILIFSDEAYEQIVYDAPHVSIGSLNGMQDYVVSFFSFSKTYAMCGYRLGWASGPKDLIKAMTDMHVYTSLSAPTISQLVGKEALNLPTIYTNSMVREYRRRRDMLVRRLNELGLDCHVPEGAFYCFPSIKRYAKNSYKFAIDLLMKGKVATIPGTEFGKYGEGFIRCSYATDYKKIELALDRIEKYLKRFK